MKSCFFVCLVMSVSGTNYSSRWTTWWLKLAWHIWATKRSLMYQRAWCVLRRIWWRGRQSPYLIGRNLYLPLWPKYLTLEAMSELQGMHKSVDYMQVLCVYTYTGRRSKRHEFDPWGQEDPLEEGMATHSNILAWRLPWTEEPGGLQSMQLQRVGHDWSNLACTHIQMLLRWVSSYSHILLCHHWQDALPKYRQHQKTSSPEDDTLGKDFKKAVMRPETCSRLIFLVLVWTVGTGVKVMAGSRWRGKCYDSPGEREGSLSKDCASP